jgi:hypothetical protein
MLSGTHLHPQRWPGFVKTAVKSVCTLIALNGLFLGATSASMWNATGHMITASIAESRLEPEVKAEVHRLIGILAGFEPSFSDMVPAATWMDAIKEGRQGLTAFNDWHYFDQPYNPFGLPGVKEPAAQNVVWAIGQAAATVGSSEATDFEKALMLRMLIHFVGDLHQPLHMTNRFTLEHPDGDFGGNLFEISGGDYPSSLHAYWDGTAGLFDFVHANGDWSPVDSMAAVIEARVPYPDSALLSDRGSRGIGEWISADAATWALESYRHGVNDAFEGIEQGETPSAAYEARAQEVVGQRLAWGGYRLAAILNAVVKSGIEHAR